MKRIVVYFLSLIFSVSMFGQIAALPGQVNPVSQATNGAVGPAGVVTNPSGNLYNVSAGPIQCAGSRISYINNTQLNLLASSTYYIVSNCAGEVIAQTVPPLPGQVPINTVVTGATTNTSMTDNRQLSNFPLVTDYYYWVPESACSGAVTGTGGSGNATDILAGSGGARVFRLSSTNAGASTDTFTCVFVLPSRLTTGKGTTINDITFLVSDQTTMATSVTLPTFKSFTAPAAVDPETANSATFVAAGGTITQAPTSTQFAAYTAVNAGQFYTIKASLGTPVVLNNDLQVFQFVIAIAQSASAAMVLETPGFYVHCTYIPL